MVTSTYACNTTGEFFEVANVTVRHDLIDRAIGDLVTQDRVAQLDEMLVSLTGVVTGQVFAEILEGLHGAILRPS